MNIFNEKGSHLFCRNQQLIPCARRGQLAVAALDYSYKIF